MYALGSSSQVYHLAAPKTPDRTVCGLGVSPAVIEPQANPSLLQLTSERPANSVLCEECANLELKRILD